MKSNDCTRFIVCRAAAGSGKTYTLVRQYLELAFDAPKEKLHKRFGTILAITFTNKAANEMKSRILTELNHMALLPIEDKQNQMGKDIAQDLHMDAQTLREYADIVRKAILHNYSDLAVCTIDSFMHHVVRTFAHDLNLPMNFDVYLDNNDLIENAVDNLMGMAGAPGQEELTDVLCEFAEQKMNEDKSYMIEKELSELAQELFKEETPAYLSSLRNISPTQFRQMHQEMQTKNRSYEENMRKQGQQGWDIITQEGLSADDFFYKESGAGAYFRKLANGDLSKPGNRAIAYLTGDKLGEKKVADKLAAIKPRLLKVHQDIETLRANEEALYNSRRLLMKHLYSLAVLNTMNELVNSYAKENDIVHISEFNKRISEVVKSEPMPFIYERIGSHYTNYLIDEFQDTSRMQWQNLVPLVENGVAQGHTSLVVGDGKQAIYRFRKGDVEQFLELPHVDSDIHGRLLENKEVAAIQRLDTNYRSRKTVVEFNNSFFEWALQKRFAEHSEMQEIYVTPRFRAEDDTADTPDLAQLSKKEGGYVQLGFWQLDEGETKYEPLCEQMLQDIERQVKEKGYHYRDITILGRDKKTLNKISSYLTLHGIPVVSSESFLLSQSHTVMLLRSLFQYLVDGNDRAAAMRVALHLRSLGRLPHDTWDHEIFMDSANGRPSPRLLERLLQREGIALNCDTLRGLGLYDGCEEAIRMLGLSTTENAYTATLLNILARYSSSHRQDWSEFLEWFDSQLDELSTCTSDDLDAIRMMTIHKAKGLESPIIMYPVLTTRKHTASLWIQTGKGNQPTAEETIPVSLMQAPAKDSATLYDDQFRGEELKQEIDDLNVLYVALTRPKDKLMVYCQNPAKDNVSSYAALLRDYLKELPAELTDGRWSTGDDSAKEKKAEEKKDNMIKEIPEAAVPLRSITFPTWMGRIAIAQQAEEKGKTTDSAAARWGSQTHAILSLMQNADNCTAAIQRYQRQHPDEDLDADRMKLQLERMMQQAEVARFFDARYECKNECSLVWQGKVLRPDRIVLAGDETWVVDFKTGMPTAEHHGQVDDYCAAIRAMGYPNVRGYLLYIGTERCQMVAC